MAALRSFFTPLFSYVRVFEMIYPTPHNLYFWASDRPTPSDA